MVSFPLVSSSSRALPKANVRPLVYSPLCIEEFDLSDRNFRPCPCGYQVCQFCFNNIKENMNGLCPACRRPYDEKTIQWKVVTQEE